MREADAYAIGNNQPASSNIQQGYHNGLNNTCLGSEIVAPQQSLRLNSTTDIIAGDRRSNPIGRLLLRNGRSLSFFERSTIYRWLEDHQTLREIYQAKERLTRTLTHSLKRASKQSLYRFHRSSRTIKSRSRFTTATYPHFMAQRNSRILPHTSD